MTYLNFILLKSLPGDLQFSKISPKSSITTQKRCPSCVMRKTLDLTSLLSKRTNKHIRLQEIRSRSLKIIPTLQVKPHLTSQRGHDSHRVTVTQRITVCYFTVIIFSHDRCIYATVTATTFFSTTYLLSRGGLDGEHGAASWSPHPVVRPPTIVSAPPAPSQTNTHTHTQTHTHTHEQPSAPRAFCIIYHEILCRVI